MNKNKRFIVALLVAIMFCVMMMTEKVFATTIVSDQTGVSTEKQSVYSGPGINYGIIGIIGEGQEVYVVDCELDWYRIIYSIGDNETQGIGYVPTDKLTHISGLINESAYQGHQGYMLYDQQVWISPSLGLDTGYIKEGEGVTVLGYMSLENDEEIRNMVVFIEYSTPEGPKRGFIADLDAIFVQEETSSVARVLHDSDLYYGNDKSLYAKAGTVYANEYVTVLAKKGDWVYVEFNTKQGRGRGYLLQSDLEFLNTPVVSEFLDWGEIEFNDLEFVGFNTNQSKRKEHLSESYFLPQDSLELYPEFYNEHDTPFQDVRIIGEYTVYAGPSASYMVVGNIANTNATLFPDSFTDIRLFSDLITNGYVYVEWETASGLIKSGESKKSGWIPYNNFKMTNL